MSFQKSEYGLMIFFSYLALILSSSQVSFEKTKWTWGFELAPFGDITEKFLEFSLCGCGAIKMLHHA
jgi:hypothetical protein